MSILHVTLFRERRRESDCEEHEPVAVKGSDAFTVADEREYHERDDGLGDAEEEDPSGELEDCVSRRDSHNIVFSWSQKLEL
jgi:hypothetical protein